MCRPLRAPKEGETSLAPTRAVDDPDPHYTPLRAMNIGRPAVRRLHPYDGPSSPHPHPIEEGHFDPDYVYKVLGMYNPSETSECYFVLSNTQRQIWFIPPRHLLAYRLIDSDEFFLPKSKLDGIAGHRLSAAARMQDG